MGQCPARDNHPTSRWLFELLNLDDISSCGERKPQLLRDALAKLPSDQVGGLMMGDLACVLGRLRTSRFEARIAKQAVFRYFSVSHFRIDPRLDLTS
jgi:hypothetical protein